MLGMMSEAGILGDASVAYRKNSQNSHRMFCVCAHVGSIEVCKQEQGQAGMSEIKDCWCDS